MKLYLTTNTKLDLSELAKFYIEPTVNQTKDKLKPVHNPYFGTTWGDFNQVRSYHPANDFDARCFISDKASYKAAGIEYMGNYDLLDKDGIMDFYGYIVPTLNDRAKLNGFKTITAWLIVHELSHGLLQKYGFNEIDSANIVHEAEANGKLQELYFQYYNELLKTKIDLLGQLLKAAKWLFAIKKKPSLQPLVKRKADAIMEAMAIMGHPVRIVEGYRSPERQDELYAQGRTKSGLPVTNAKAGESLHQYGVAIDLVFKNEGYNAKQELWETLGAVVESQGFTWGGRWPNFPDKPHAELLLGYSLEDFQCGKVDYTKYN